MLTVVAIIAVAVGAAMWVHIYRTPPRPTDTDRHMINHLRTRYPQDDQS